MTSTNETVAPQQSGSKAAALLQQALPADWTSEEQLLFRNWLQQIVTLQDTLTNIAKDRPKLMWRACGIYRKLRAHLSEQPRQPSRAMLRVRLSRVLPQQHWGGQMNEVLELLRDTT